MEAELIQSDPAVMMGKPVVSGTRITVELILEKLSAGETVDQILEAHPRLTREGVLAALGFAARALRADGCLSNRWAKYVNLLADEGVDKPIIDRLRQNGHTVLYISELDQL